MGIKDDALKVKYLHSYFHIPKLFSHLSGRSNCFSKWIMWIFSKSHRENFFLEIFAIQSSSRHEKRCQMCVRLICLFQCSRNQQYICHCSLCFWRINRVDNCWDKYLKRDLYARFEKSYLYYLRVKVSLLWHRNKNNCNCCFEHSNSSKTYFQNK